MKAYKILAKFNKPIYPEVPEASNYHYVLANSQEEAESTLIDKLKFGGCDNIRLETEVIFIEDFRK